MSDFDSDDAAASSPNYNKESFKNFIQKEMRSCILDTVKEVMSSKRPLPFQDDLPEEPITHNVTFINQGKKAKKSKNTEPFLKSTMRGPSTSSDLGVLAPQTLWEVFAP